MDKISIITPSFNQAKYLEQTIKSVVEQEYPNLEYLIMDGGSTDGSVDIIKKYAALYPQIIKWQSQKDKGQVDAINQGIKKATGDIIAYINSDDYYLPGSFVLVADYFRDHKKSLWLVGDCQVSDPKLSWTFTLKHYWPVQSFKSASFVLNTINQPSVFLRKKLVDKVGLFNPEYPLSFDHEYWLRCVVHQLPARLRRPLSVFRTHPKSLSNQLYEKQLKEDYEIVKKYSRNNKLLLLLHRLGQVITIKSYQKLK